jgi:hypothetical protein
MLKERRETDPGERATYRIRVENEENAERGVPEGTLDTGPERQGEDSVSETGVCSRGRLAGYVFSLKMVQEQLESRWCGCRGLRVVRAGDSDSAVNDVYVEGSTESAKPIR